MSQKTKLTEQFRLRFEQLRSAVNHNPRTLVTFFQERPEFEALCNDLMHVADVIEKAGNYRKAFPQVAPGFITDFKDYQYNWKAEVTYVASWPLLSLFGLTDDLTPPSFDEFKKTFRRSNEKSGPDTHWDTDFDPSVHDGAAAIHEMLSLAADQGQFRRENATDDISDYIANTLLVGVEAFEYFENTIGIDVGTAFRRWNKLPAVFVPKHVSDRHGLSEKGSLYALLDEAVRAYVADAPAAAVAMCRALLELILRDHYLKIPRKERIGLGGVIDLAAARYDFLSKPKLDGLRETANKVLHNFDGGASMTTEDEDAILQLFKDLKFYIEKAPAR